MKYIHYQVIHMEKKKDLYKQYAILSIIGVFGFLYKTRPLDLDSQISLSFYVFLIIAGLLFSMTEKSDRRRIQIILTIFFIVLCVFIGLYNLK